MLVYFILLKLSVAMEMLTHYLFTQKLCSKWPDMLDEHISNLTEDLWLFILKRDVLNTDEVQLFTGLYIWWVVLLYGRLRFI